MKAGKLVALAAMLALALSLSAGVYAAEGKGSDTKKIKAPGELAPELIKKLEQAGFTPYRLKLPKPMFVGTPENLKTPNLEKVSGKKRKMPYWPKGLKNVALNKEVTASDDEPVIGEIEMLTDDDKEAADGHYMELGPGLQWVQIDLEENYEVFGVLIWHYHAQARVFFDVVVKCADDKDFITGVKTLFNNDHDNSAGLGVGKQKEYIESNEGKLIETNDGDKLDGKGVKTRYIRLYSKGNS